jgi:hypothetical protein
MATMQIPVTIPQEVTDYVASLGLQAEFEEILDSLPEHYPNPSKIICEFDAGNPEEEDPSVIISPYLEDKGPTFPTPHMNWSRWAVQRFPGRDLYHFSIVEYYEERGNAGA